MHSKLQVLLAITKMRIEKKSEFGESVVQFRCRRLNAEPAKRRKRIRKHTQKFFQLITEYLIGEEKQSLSKTFPKLLFLQRAF